MNAIVMTLARMASVKAVKRELQARGLKSAHIEPRVISMAARAYLQEHPELIEQAAETVQQVPALRKMAERHERDRARIRE